MKKHLAYYENEWPANITELTAIENKPFVGYLKSGKQVRYTVIPKAAEGPANNEIWYTSSTGNVVPPYGATFGASIVTNTYEDDKGVIKFNNSVTIIGERAFAYCSSLTSITIPNSVTKIRNWAFAQCSSLISITFEGTMEEWNSITKYDYWKTDHVPATYVQCTDGQVTL